MVTLYNKVPLGYASTNKQYMLLY